MHIFHCYSFSDDLAFLDEVESNHAFKVMRLRQGEEVMVLDGFGGEYECVIMDPHPRKGVLRVNKHAKHPVPARQIEIAIAPTKLNERYEWFLEKATELGIFRVVPVICDRSERRVINQERMLKVIVSASKQSRNVWFPEFSESIGFKDYISKTSPGLIAHCSAGERKELIDSNPDSAKIRVLIGPEGDFSDTEISLALSKGWQPVSLGPLRLRTETAGIYALIVAGLLQNESE